MPEVELLAELPEARATGDLQRIYGEIRRLSAVPMVALVYRHLATVPGVLEWAWDGLGPVMRSGQLQQRAWDLAAQTPLPAAPALPRAALRAAGITAADEDSIVAVLEAYNRANPVNILALRCLALHLGGAPGADSQDEASATWHPPAPPGPLPAMIDPAAMDPNVRALVLLLTDRSDGRPPSALWPSLYRHLAHWPAMLGFAGVLVPPLFAGIDAAAAGLRDRVERAAAELARGMPAHGGCEPPPDAQRGRLQAAITNFTQRIPEMVVIGGLLQHAMSKEAT
jgi:hypothetical protein